jgi:hypothetical protein
MRSPVGVKPGIGSGPVAQGCGEGGEKGEREPHERGYLIGYRRTGEAPLRVRRR